MVNCFFKGLKFSADKKFVKADGRENDFPSAFIFSVTPRNKMRMVALMLKAIYAQENKIPDREKALHVSEKLRYIELAKAAKKARMK